MSGRKVRWEPVAVLVFLTAFFLFLANESRAAEVMLGVGTGVANLDQDIRSQQLGVRFDGRWLVDLTRTGAGTRSDDGKALPENWRVSALRTVTIRREDAWIRPFLGFGVAYWHEAPAAVVNDRVMFDLRVGAQIRNVMISWQHNSTAGRTSPNSGHDMVLLTMRLPFP
jgi:hypothetical protein